MGYNTTLGPLVRWASTLDKIHAGNSQIATTDSKTLAYRLHEALKAAQANNVEPYASMDLTFRTSPGYLHVQTKSPLILPGNEERSSDEFPAAVTFFDVVQAASGYTSGVLEFPSWDNINIQGIEAWAKAKGWIVTTDKVLTLSRSQ